jgi:hypothetical protein
MEPAVRFRHDDSLHAWRPSLARCSGHRATDPRRPTKRGLPGRGVELREVPRHCNSWRFESLSASAQALACCCHPCVVFGSAAAPGRVSRFAIGYARGEAPLGFAEPIEERTVEYDHEALRHFRGGLLGLDSLSFVILMLAHPMARLRPSAVSGGWATMILSARIRL